MMIDRLQTIEARYQELSRLIAQPETMSDMEAWRKLVKEHAQIEPIAQKSEEYQALLKELEECRQLAEEETDAELRDLAAEESKHLQEKKEEMEEEIRFLLLPKDPNDDKTWCWKYGPEQGAMKRRCSGRIYTVCMPDMQSARDSSWRL